MPDVIVSNLNAETIEKALVKTKAHRERDMKGHLANENEGFEDEDESSDGTPKKKTPNPNPAQPNPELMHIFWGDDDTTKSESSPKAKLLKEDFQLLQAYNYLRGWKVIKSFDEVKDDTLGAPDANDSKGGGGKSDGKDAKPADGKSTDSSSADKTTKAAKKKAVAKKPANKKGSTAPAAGATPAAATTPTPATTPSPTTKGQ
jgi:hypothetical protein